MAPTAPLSAAPPCTHSSEDEDAPPAAAPAAAPPADETTTAEPPPVVIPQAIIPEDCNFSVRLSAVHDPSDFFGHVLVDDDSADIALSQLQDEMNHHASMSDAPPEESVTGGSFWMGQGDGGWYRVRVLEVMETSGGRIAKVIDVDYGNRRTLPLTNLRPLPLHLAEPPARALHMTLAFVEPMNGRKWDSAATLIFIRETGFEAVLCADCQGQRDTGTEIVAVVVLLGNKRPTRVSINDLLVEEGVAMPQW